MRALKNELLLAIALSLILSSPASADDKCADIDEFSGFDVFEFQLEDEDQKRLKEYCKIYYGIKSKEPEHLNAALAPVLERSNGLALLKDIDFKFKTFQSEDGNTGLGFSYDYTKTNELGEYEYIPEKNLTRGTAWKFSTKGNVAFDSDLNPADFTDTRFSIVGFRDYGGISSASKASAETAKELNRLDDAAVDLSGDALRENTARVKSIMSEFFQTQVYLGYDLNIGVEANQDYTSKQWTYGFKLVVDAKGYGKNNELGKWNLLDYPFALVRVLTGFNNESKLKPLGYSFPTFLIGLDQVDPKDNETRKALGENDIYDRVKAEIHFRTPIWGSQNSLVFANLDWRYWEEISPEDVIKDAGLGRFDYLTFTISSASGIFVSYSDGRLPFDLEDKRVYEIGWKTHLE